MSREEQQQRLSRGYDEQILTVNEVEEWAKQVSKISEDEAEETVHSIISIKEERKQ